jgi:hypothetical protein
MPTAIFPKCRIPGLRKFRHCAPLRFIENPHSAPFSNNTTHLISSHTAGISIQYKAGKKTNREVSMLTPELITELIVLSAMVVPITQAIKKWQKGVSV